MDPSPQNELAKEELIVCMGSACHQHGVYDVLPKLQKLIQEHGMEPRVELKGRFCLDHCAEGITLKHRERIFTRINPQNIAAKFVAEVLPSLRGESGRGA